MEDQSDNKTTETPKAQTASSKRSTAKNYFYPEHGVTVVANSREEADNLLKEKLTTKEKDNG